MIKIDVDVAYVESEDGVITVLVPVIEFSKARNASTNTHPDIEFDIDEIGFLPQTGCELTGSRKQSSNVINYNG